MPSFFKSVINTVSSGVGNFANEAIADVKDQISAFGSDLGFNKTANLPLSSRDTTAIVFPEELRSTTMPIVQFTAFERDGGSVNLHHMWFPCPAGVTIADAATYNTIDLGAIGSTVRNAAAAAQGSDGFIDAAKNIGSSITNQAKNLKAAEVGAIAAQKIPFNDSIAAQAQFDNKVIMNPNTNTTFGGNTIRNFQFQFKLIARSQAETEAVRKIHNKFRAFTYADSRSNSQNLILAYPPTWTIKFLDTGKKENKYIPKIFSCYLTGFTSTFNPTVNMFHEDGSPLEVDISLQYQETRVLTRKDIDDLEAGLLGDRGVDENGFPTRQQPAQQLEKTTNDTAPGGGS
jgi:hypothetical protein